jgi:hypothetical protein
MSSNETTSVVMITPLCSYFTQDHMSRNNSTPEESLSLWPITFAIPKEAMFYCRLCYHITLGNISKSLERLKTRSSLQAHKCINIGALVSSLRVLRGDHPRKCERRKTWIIHFAVGSTCSTPTQPHQNPAANAWQS